MTDSRRKDGTSDDRAGMHRHAHQHEGRPAHRHVHHHAPRPAGHEHAHAPTFDTLSYICSPVHDLDARAKIAAALCVVLGVVLGGPPRLLETIALASLLTAVTYLARLPLGRLLARSLLVVPFAGTVALLAPLQGAAGSLSPGVFAGAYAEGGWVLAWSVLGKAWLCAYALLLLAASTPPPKLFAALRSLKVPSVIVAILSFLYRYADVLSRQLASVRRAIASRGPSLGGLRRARLYGNLAGNLFVRAYERGERVHGAMVARGYSGTLPVSEPSRFGPGDLLVIALALPAGAALLLY